MRNKVEWLHHTSPEAVLDCGADNFIAHINNNECQISVDQELWQWVIAGIYGRGVLYMVIKDIKTLFIISIKNGKD